MKGPGDGEGPAAAGPHPEKQQQKQDSESSSRRSRNPLAKLFSRHKTRINPEEGEIDINEVLRKDTDARKVEADYPVPSWLKRQGVSAPCEYSKTFKGKFGIINYEVLGPSNARTVLTFHGLNGSMQTFQDLQNVLVGFGFRAITFDLYGHGLSGSPQYLYFKKRYSADFFVSQARELLCHLGLQDIPLAVVGFSMGGVIAARYACLFPSHVTSIALISAAGLLPKKPLAVSLLQRCGCCCSPLYLCVPCCLCHCCFDKENFLKRYERDGHEVTTNPQGNPQSARPRAHSDGEGAGGTRPQEGRPTDAWEETDVSNGSSRNTNAGNNKHTPAPAAAPAAAAAAEGAASGNTPAGIAATTTRSYSSSPGYLLWKRLTWQVFAKKGSVSTFVGCVTHVPMWDGQKIFEQLGKQQTPCLVLWGGEDPLVNVQCCKRLCSLLPNHAAIVFPGCHHLLLAERPHACIALVLTFLDFPAPAPGGGPPGGPQGPPYMPVWRYLLPFSPDGEYIQPQSRCPPGKTTKEFLDSLQYKPKFHVCFGGGTKGPADGGPQEALHRAGTLPVMPHAKLRERHKKPEETPFKGKPHKHQQQEQQQRHKQETREISGAPKEGPQKKGEAETGFEDEEEIIVTPDAGKGAFIPSASMKDSTPTKADRGESPGLPLGGPLGASLKSSGSFQDLFFTGNAEQSLSSPCDHFAVSRE